MCQNHACISERLQETMTLQHLSQHPYSQMYWYPREQMREHLSPGSSQSPMSSGVGCSGLYQPQEPSPDHQGCLVSNIVVSTPYF